MLYNETFSIIFKHCVCKFLLRSSASFRGGASILRKKLSKSNSGMNSKLSKFMSSIPRKFSDQKPSESNSSDDDRENWAFTVFEVDSSTTSIVLNT